MNVHDLGSNKAPQSDGRIVVIDEAQKQLGDTMKALDKEVKDLITSLWTEVNELAATMKVIMMAMGKTPIFCDTSECKGKDKVLEHKLDVGKRNA